MAAFPPPPADPPQPPNEPPPPQYGSQMPGQVPPPIVPMAAVAGGGINLMYQFGSTAGYSVLLGLASIAVPLFFGYVFYILPIFGVIAGIPAIMPARLIRSIA